MKRTSWSTGMSVTGDGGAVIAHAGSIGLRMLAENTGLTGALSTAMARRSFIPSVHDRGQVLTDVAVMLADGGEAISDIDVLRHQGQVLGPVASAPTVWRALDEVTDARRRKIQAARARVRRHVWAQLTAAGGVPASKVAGTDLGSTVVLDVDATIVVTHSEKELASPTFKRTFGYHPIGVWCDNTGEFLAAALRTGRAGSNTAVDHIQVLGEAITQIPMPYRRNLLIRCDGAGASHQLLDWLHAQGQVRGRTLHYSVGFTIGEKVRAAITELPAGLWSPALTAEGEVREGGDVAELTGLLDLTSWPAGMREILRRERPHPGAQLSLFEVHDGWRYQAFAHKHHERHSAVPGGPASGACPGRGPDPSRQGFWAGTFPVSRVRHQPDLACTDDDRRRSGGLAQDARPRRRPRQSRTKGTQVSAAARPGKTRSRRPTATTASTQDLALGRAPGGRVRPDRRDPTTALTPPRPHQAEETWRTAHRQRQPANSHALTRPSVQIGRRQPSWQLSSRLMKEGG